MGEYVRKELTTGEVVVLKAIDAALDELGDLYRKRAAALIQLETYRLSYPTDTTLVDRMMTIELILR